MSEFSINQPPIFSPADMFRRQQPYIRQSAEIVDVSIPEASTPSESEPEDLVNAADEHTFSEEAAAEATVADSIHEPTEEVVAKGGRFRRAGRIGKRAVEATVLSLALNPLTNEGSRLAIAGTVEATTHSAALTALAWGGSTLVIESGAALITSDLLQSERAPKTIAWLNKMLGKVGVKETTKFNPMVKAGISYIAGSGVAVFVEQREDQTRTRSQNIRYGLKNAAALSVVCGAQGALVANGIADPSPLAIGGAIIGVGSFFAVGKWAKDRVSHATPESIIPSELVITESVEEIE
jgi:hypothetical protein